MVNSRLVAAPGTADPKILTKSGFGVAVVTISSMVTSEFVFCLVIPTLIGLSVILIHDGKKKKYNKAFECIILNSLVIPKNITIQTIANKA